MRAAMPPKLKPSPRRATARVPRQYAHTAAALLKRSRGVSQTVRREMLRGLIFTQLLPCRCLSAPRLFRMQTREGDRDAR